MSNDRSPDTVTEAIQLLEGEGYTASFSIVDGVLQCDRRAYCAIDDAVVERVYRFEGPSDPGDEMIVFGLSDPQTGQRGVIASAFGIDADPELFTHLVGLHDRFDKHP